MTKQQRLILVVAILASFVAFLDGSVTNVALPAIARELGGGLATQQWVVDAYLITLGSFILIAGSLSDIWGRKKILASGLLGFLFASFLCAIAPSGIFLIVARAIQGLAGALLVPSSLAIIISTFKEGRQGKAIGIWTAWTGIASLIGPLLGGFLVDTLSWRFIFVVNVVPIAITLWLLRLSRLTEERRASQHVDTRGAVLCAVGLGSSVFALIKQSQYGWHNPIIFTALFTGLAALGLFVWHERQSTQPMLPLELFASRNFAVGNIATAAIYAGLSVAVFLITIFIQQVGGYSALSAGMALLPVTAIMFGLSSRSGALAGTYGPRFFMVAGPLIGAAGFLLLLRVDKSAAYWTQLFPAISVFGLGLSLTVAPLTAAILGAVDQHFSGVASAVNNAVARIAGMIAIAGLGVVAGPHLTVNGFHNGVVVMSALLAAGGAVSAIGIRNPK